MTQHVIRQQKTPPISPRHNQRGSVLIVALILMIGATLLTIAEFKSSMMQEKMTSNQYAKENARLAAEQGAARARAWINGLSVVDWNTWMADPVNNPAWSSDPESVSVATAVAASGGKVVDKSNGNSTEHGKGKGLHAEGMGTGKGEYKGIPSTGSGSSFLVGGGLYWIDPSEIKQDPSDSDYALLTVHGAIKDDTSDKLLAEAELIVRARKPTQSTGTPNPGVYACNALSLSGSGKIDSFDSRLGAYGDFFTNDDGGQEQNSLRTNVTISTISDQATGALSGSSPIYGDLIFTGPQLGMSGGTPVYGDIYAEGNISMDGSIGDLDGDGTRDGTIYARGDVNFGTASAVQDVQAGGDVSVSGTINGELAAGGNIALDSSSNTSAVSAVGNITIGATGTPPSSATAGGTVSWPDWWQWDAEKQALTSNYQSNAGPTAPNIPSVYDPSKVCDDQGARDANGNLGEMFTNAMSGASSMADVIPDTDDNPPNGPDYGISGNKGNGYSLSGPGTTGNALELGAADTATQIHVDSNLTTSGDLAAININGDVTLVVDGNFNLGDNTQLNIQDGASLTLYVTGKTTLSAGTNMTSSNFIRTDADGNPTPAVKIISAYQSSDQNDTGVEISGANDTDAVIYAPYAATNIAASGDVSGSVHTKYLNISGAGGFHYDEALGVLGGSGGGNPTPGKLTGWFETL